MSDPVLSQEKEISAENSTAVLEVEIESPARPSHAKRWLTGWVGMAICCGAPLLLIAAIAFFGLSLGAIASGAVSLLALLACPVGMYLMMRSMNKN